MDKEIWKDVAGFEGKYQISNRGRVKRLETAKKYAYFVSIHRSSVQKANRRLCATLIDTKGRITTKYIHRMVAEAFVPKPETNGTKLNCVLHKDGNIDNNAPENLYWANQEAERVKTWVVPVEQRTKTGVLVKRYPSMTEAAKAVGTSVANISKACDSLGRNSAVGYIWKRLQSKYEKQD